MASPATRPGKSEGRSIVRNQACLVLLISMEAVLVLMIVFAPWAYGAEPAGFEFLLDAGVSLLVILWGLRILAEGELAWKKCSVFLCLAGLFVLGLLQLMPLGHAWVSTLSPSTARLYEQLLPAQPEQLPGARVSAARASADPVAGSTLSLYPQRTRIHLQRILSILLIFAVVRNNLGTAGSVRRLGTAALINGALLSLFALLQYFSSPADVLYWTYPSGGRVFGPFIYRNHFACYVNLCIGLAFGLLWNRRERLEQRDHEQAFKVAAASRGFSGRLNWRAWLKTPLAVLNDSTSLWICAALALMVSSVVFSLSRGGFLALVGGLGACFFIRMSRSARFLRPGAALLSLTLAVGLLGWFGLRRVEERLTTLVQGNALHESRFPLWSGVLRIVLDFPVWGTGYGTYQYVDPLYRTNPALAEFTVDHVHNDYLELLVEGGLVGLLLYLFALGLVFLRGYRVVRRGRKGAGLALGALLALATFVIHSFGDFDIHVPAITLLATVLCAQVASMNAAGRLTGGPLPQADDENAYTLRWRGLAPVAGALICAALAVVVFETGWRLHAADSLHNQAFRVANATAPEGFAQKRDLLEAAVRLTPHDAGLRTQLGELYANMFRQQDESLNSAEQTNAATEVILCLSPGGLPPGTAFFTGMTSLQGKATLQALISKTQKQRWAALYLAPALGNYVQARNDAPLLPGPHLGLALHAEPSIHSETFGVCMARVQRLAPSDPTFWYFCGNQELFHGHYDRAWKSWRRCLELSDRYFLPIIERSAKLVRPVHPIHEILPDKPGLLVSAALKLYPLEDPAGERRALLERALTLLQKQITLSHEEVHIKALAQKHLGRSAEATTIYQNLLARDPLQYTWRFELAQLLHEEGQLAEARAQLLSVLVQKPRHPEAYQLLTTINRELAQRR